MNKTLTKLLIIVGILAAGAAHATTPAETAGICAGNALKVGKIAQVAGAPSIEQKALAQQNRLYERYGKQPGFAQAATASFNRDITIQDRLSIADGCLARGF